MEKYTPGNLVGHGKTQWEVRRPIALRCGKVRLKRAQVAQVSPMSREHRVYRASVALHVQYYRLDLHCNMCHCEATQDRVSTLFSLCRVIVLLSLLPIRMIQHHIAAILLVILLKLQISHYCIYNYLIIGNSMWCYVYMSLCLSF
jgi:hypothetical protein